jgi:hypothetical protein
VTEVAAYETWTAEELRDELRARELPASGNKPELVARLKESDAAPPEQAPQVDDEPAEPTKPPETVADRPALADPAALKRETEDGMCAVDDGTAHFADGRAIPGTKVCSAHEIHYLRDGTLRGA